MNPATEQPFGRAAAASADDVDAAVEAARAAFDTGPWPRLCIQERAAALLRFADALEADSEPLAELVMMETGLPWKEGIGGTRSMTTMLRYYAGLADRVELAERRQGITGVTASLEKVPLGVVATIVPWNGPISMASVSLPAALLAGCTVVLKPSELTPLSAGYLADAALAAGLPPGVLNVIAGQPAAGRAVRPRLVGAEVGQQAHRAVPLAPAQALATRSCVAVLANRQAAPDHTRSAGRAGLCRASQ